MFLPHPRPLSKGEGRRAVEMTDSLVVSNPLQSTFVMRIKSAEIHSIFSTPSAID